VSSLDNLPCIFTRWGTAFIFWCQTLETSTYIVSEWFFTNRAKQIWAGYQVRQVMLQQAL
jgi:hypothetical protein